MERWAVGQDNRLRIECRDESEVELFRHLLDFVNSLGRTLPQGKRMQPGWDCTQLSQMPLCMTAAAAAYCCRLLLQLPSFSRSKFGIPFCRRCRPAGAARPAAAGARAGC